MTDDETPRGGTRRTDPASDLALVRATLAGAPGALDRLALRLRCIAAILANRNRKLGKLFDDHELEDLAQDVTTTVWTKLGEFAGESALETWVYSFCWNHLMNATRAKTRRLPIETTEGPPQVEDPSDPAESLVQRAELVYRALEELEGHQRTIVRLRHMDGLSFPDIARRLSMPVSTAKTHYARGLELLRRFLGPYYQEEYP